MQPSHPLLALVREVLDAGFEPCCWRGLVDAPTDRDELVATGARLLAKEDMIKFARRGRFEGQAQFELRLGVFVADDGGMDWLAVISCAPDDGENVYWAVLQCAELPDLGRIPDYGELYEKAVELNRRRIISQAADLRAPNFH